MTAYWAWSKFPALMHAWELTEDQVQAAKRSDAELTALCGFQGRIGERPMVTPHSEPEQNHCASCWRKLHPRPHSLFLPALVTPDIAEPRWRAIG